MRVYVAAPLFGRAERDFNESIEKELKKEGLNVFLPQDRCNQNVFECCIENLEKSDAVLAVFDGAQVDDGTAFECGYAFAKEIPVVGLRTDFRRVGEYAGEVNAMLNNCGILCKNLEDAIRELKKMAVD